jgi:hypothetical protein
MKTVSMRRTIAAPIDEVFDWLVDGTNWASVPGMIYSRVSPADGPEPHGVGSVREFATWASKGTEVITAFERPPTWAIGRCRRYRRRNTTGDR